MALEIEEGERPPLLDPTTPAIIAVFGKKQSGKSTLNRAIYKSWRGDKFCIDVNGDAKPGDGPDGMEGVEVLHQPLPEKMPERVDGKPRNLYWRADPLSATYVDDLDRALRIGLYPQRRPTLVWAGEIGEFTKGGGRTGPFLRLALRQNAHYNLTLLTDDPRPHNTDKLIIGQANHAITYRMPDPDDRQFFAKCAGIPPKDFEEAHDELINRGPYWFLDYDAINDVLYLHPPLPVEAAR